MAAQYNEDCLSRNFETPKEQEDVREPEERSSPEDSFWNNGSTTTNPPVVTEEILNELLDAIFARLQALAQDEAMGEIRIYREADHICLDILKGTKEKISTFLLETLRDRFRENLFVFIEHDELPEFELLVKSGSIIMNAGTQEVAELLKREGNRSEIVIDSGAAHGSVSCLGKVSTQQIVVLTAMHVLKNPSKPSHKTTIVTKLDGKYICIGSKYVGYIGGIEADRLTSQMSSSTRAVDVAAVELTSAYQETLSDKLMLRLPHTFHDVQKESLKGCVVTKHGAGSGFTTGIVVRTSYFSFPSVRGDNRPIGEYFMVVAKDRPSSFARQGDSGALVCTSDKTPIGLVVGQFSNYYYEGKAAEATLCVYFTSCIKALGLRGVNIEHCYSYGAEFSEEEDPSLEIRYEQQTSIYSDVGSTSFDPTK